MTRPTWPPPTDEQLRADIRESDAASFDDRLARYRFIFEEFGPPGDMLLIGGMPSMLAIHELQRSFIDGNFLATILAAQVFVEHSLGGAFAMSGDDKVVNAGFAMLIDESEKRGVLSSTIAERLHSLRTMRNPYTHPRVGLHAKGYMARLRDSSTWDPYELAEQDAREAVRIVVDWLREGSPGWLPPKR